MWPRREASRLIRKSTHRIDAACFHAWVRHVNCCVGFCLFSSASWASNSTDNTNYASSNHLKQRQMLRSMRRLESCERPLLFLSYSRLHTCPVCSA